MTKKKTTSTSKEKKKKKGVFVATKWTEVVAGMRQKPPALLKALFEFVDGGGSVPFKTFRFVGQGNLSLQEHFDDTADQAASYFDVFGRYEQLTSTSYLALWTADGAEEPCIVIIDDGIVGYDTADFIRYLSTAPEYFNAFTDESGADIESLEVPKSKAKKNEVRRDFVNWATKKGVSFTEDDVERMNSPSPLIAEFGEIYNHLMYAEEGASLDDSKKKSAGKRSDAAANAAKLAKHSAAAPTNVDLEKWLASWAAKEPDATDALKFWNQAFPYRGALMTTTPEERRMERERKYLINFLIDVYEDKSADSAAASEALESIGYSAHLDSDD
jgi:hypothetical protein